MNEEPSPQLLATLMTSYGDTVLAGKWRTAMINKPTSGILQPIAFRATMPAGTPQSVKDLLILANLLPSLSSFTNFWFWGVAYPSVVGDSLSMSYTGAGGTYPVGAASGSVQGAMLSSKFFTDIAQSNAGTCYLSGYVLAYKP